MNRVPELLEDIEDQEGDDASPKESQLDDLARRIPKLISILPDVLRDRSDPRHTAALDVMVTGLTERLDKVDPGLLVSCLIFCMTMHPIYYSFSLTLLCAARVWSTMRPSYDISKLPRIKHSYEKSDDVLLILVLAIKCIERSLECGDCVPASEIECNA